MLDPRYETGYNVGYRQGLTDGINAEKKRFLTEKVAIDPCTARIRDRLVRNLELAESWLRVNSEVDYLSEKDMEEARSSFQTMIDDYRDDLTHFDFLVSLRP